MPGHWLALFIHDFVNNYQLLLRDDANKAARRFDHTVSAHAADRDADTQVRQIRAVLNEPENRRPTAILVSPVRESSLIGVLSESASKGIPCIVLCRWCEVITSIRRQYPQVPVFSVSADQSEIGRTQGKILNQLLRPGDELVYIQGPHGTSSVTRRFSAMQQELAGQLGVRWSNYNSDWSVEGGHAVMTSWLQTFTSGNVPSFVVCAQNDDMALGARNAIIESKMAAAIQSPRIIGCDGLPSFGQRLVTERKLIATVYVPPVSGRAIEELFAALRGGPPPPAEINIGVEPYPSLESLVTRRDSVHFDKRSTKNLRTTANSRH
jgi:ABC-type sugar transport system substrate-binding protein